MTQVQHLSLSKFCKTYNAPKSSAWAKAQELGIDTSKGLSPADQALLISELGLDASIVDESTIVHAPQTEVLPPNGYGMNYDLTGGLKLPTVIHLHINAGNADTYNAQSANTDANIQQMIQATLARDFQQGIQDSNEVEAIAQSVKRQRVQARVAGVMQDAQAPNPDAPATGG